MPAAATFGLAGDGLGDALAPGLAEGSCAAVVSGDGVGSGAGSDGEHPAAVDIPLHVREAWADSPTSTSRGRSVGSAGPVVDVHTV